MADRDVLAALVALIDARIDTKIAAASGKLHSHYSSDPTGRAGPLPGDATRRTFCDVAREAVKRGESGFEKIGRLFVVERAAWHQLRTRKRAPSPAVQLEATEPSEEEQADALLAQAGYRLRPSQRRGAA
jgi:hypothetical protein